MKRKTNRLSAEAILTKAAHRIREFEANGFDSYTDQRVSDLIAVCVRDLNEAESLMHVNDRARPSFGSGGIWRETKVKVFTVKKKTRS